MDERKTEGEREGWNNNNAGKEAERKRHDRRKQISYVHIHTNQRRVKICGGGGGVEGGILFCINTEKIFSASILFYFFF